MISAAGIAAVCGLVFGATGVLCLVVPMSVQRFVQVFPRNRPAAVVLCAIACSWAGMLLYRMPMGQFEFLKPALYVLTPAVIVTAIFFMEELLAPRALGGILAMLPAPMLDVVRWHDSQWRLVLVVTAYVMVVAGCALLLSPYVFRKVAGRVTDSARRTRWFGAVLAVAAVGYLVLSAVL